MANVDKEAFLDPSDPYGRHRVERQRFLEQRVAETLALKPSKLCPLLKGNEHRTYKLSPDEEEREIRDYQRKSRQVRIMQVRAQEMLLAAQRVGEFRQRKKNEKLKLLQVLKEAWQEEQRNRIADVEDGLVNSCKGIGQSHNAAQEVIKNMGNIAEEKDRQAEENRLWETLRYQKAKQKESARKLEVKIDVDKLAAKDRRRVVERAAELERTWARDCASRVKSKSVVENWKSSEEGPETYLHLNFNSHDIKRNFIQSHLAGAPNDYKDTYFHSRFCILKDRTNLKSAKGSHESQNDAETDAWEAAETHLKDVELERERRAEEEELWHKCKVERGQVAVAHLQKIASLEEELAMELAEEQERKHQLQLIEEMSKAAHLSTYKSEQRKHLDPKLYAKKDVEENSASKTEESGEVDLLQEAVTVHPTAAGPLEFESTPQTQLVEELVKKPDKVVGEALMPVLDAEKSSRQSTPEVNYDKENADEMEDEVVNDKDTEIIVVRLDKLKTTPILRKPVTLSEIVDGGAEMKVSPCSSPMTVKAMQLHGKFMGPKGKTTANEAAPGPSIHAESNLPGCTPKAQTELAPSRTSKCVMSVPRVSSLPNVNSNSNIRKGNKSPPRLDSPGRGAPNDIENQGTIIQRKEAKSRSRSRQSVKSPEEVPSKRSLLPPIAHKLECSPSEGRKPTPRKHSGTWLSNVLEKLTWWKSQKHLPFSGVTVPVTQDRAEFEGLSCSSGQPARAVNKDMRKESTRKFPVKQVDSPLKCHPFNKGMLVRSKILENANIPAPAECHRDSKAGWYEAYTKDVFSPEELEALQLELYGTWTDGTVSICRNKAKFKRDKTKPGQLDNDSDVLYQQDSNAQHKVESLNNFKEVLCRSQSTEQATNYFSGMVLNKDLAVQLDCETFESKSVPGVITSDKLADRILVDKVPLNKMHCSHFHEPQCIIDAGPERKRELVNENYQLKSAPPLVDGFSQLVSQSKVAAEGVKCEMAVIESDSKGQDELSSARDVAEKLIQAWRTGHLSRTLCPMVNHGKQHFTQNSRKRTARTNEDSHMEPCVLGTGYKLGQGENINRQQQTSAAHARCGGVLTPSRQSSVPQDNNEANTNHLSHGQEKSRNTRASPKKILNPAYSKMQCSPAQSKTEVSRKSNLQTHTNLQVEEIVPEPRSLDFILGSLSTQVKELDERLQSVTSYAIHSSADECSLSLNFRKANIKVLAGKMSGAREQSKLSLKCSDGGGKHQGCKTPGCCTKEEEKSARGRSTKAVPVKLSKIGGPGLSKGNEDHVFSLISEDSPQTLKPQTLSTCCIGSRSTSTLQGQSPGSSMDICLENLADLMQQMNGSTTANQTLCKSLVENLPKYSENDTNNARNEFASHDSKNRVGTKESRQEFMSHGSPKSCQRLPGVSSRVSLRSIAELCSIKAGSAVLHANTVLDIEDPRHGIVHCRSDADPQCSLQQREHLSLLSIDLGEAMTLADIEEQLLLSGSVDFSPWSTEKLPDLFPSVENVGRSTNHDMECDTTYWDGRDVDCEGTLRPVYCHVKKESEWLLRGDKFKRKSKAYEKRRAGRVKSKQKRPPKRPFNPVASPPSKYCSSPRRPSTVAVLPKVSTTHIQPSSPLAGALMLQKKELKLPHDGSTRLNLTSRSLPAQFPGSVTAHEVQKWLCKEAVGCAASLPNGLLSRESIASIRHQARFAGCNRPDVSQLVAGEQGKPLAQAVVWIPELQVKEAVGRKKPSQPIVESRRRPASAGTLLKC